MYALCDEKCNQTGNEIHIEISKPIGIIYGRYTCSEDQKKIICVKINVHPCHHMPLRLRWDQNVKKILPDLNFITAGGICDSQTHRGS